MPTKALVSIGLALAFLAALIFWGARRWLDTRVFVPVNVPISLQADQAQTIRFTSNLSEHYFVDIQVDSSADDWTEGKCNEKLLWDLRWKMYRLCNRTGTDREFWASRDGAQHKWYVTRIVPGTYELEWETSSSATCLNARHPQLAIGTSPWDYQYDVNAIQTGTIFLGGAGLAFIFAGIKNRLNDMYGLKPPRMFPQMALRSVIALQRHRCTGPIAYPTHFNAVWASVLLILAFIFYHGLVKFPPRYGLLVKFSGMGFLTGQQSPWQETETLGVFIDDRRRFFVNGQAVDRESLRRKLQEELGKRMVWTVYFEADSNSVFQDAAYAIDTIQGLGAKAIWITPRMREEWKQERNGLH